MAGLISAEQSTFTSLFVSILISSCVASLAIQLGYQIVRFRKQAIIWRIFAIVLCFISVTVTGLSSFGVYEIAFEEVVPNWSFSLASALALGLAAVLLVQIYFIHKLQTIIMMDILANVVSSILVFFILLQLGLGTVVIVGLMKLSSSVQFFAFELSAGSTDRITDQVTDRVKICWMATVWLSTSLASDIMIFLALLHFELRVLNSGLSGNKFYLFCRIFRKTNSLSMIFSVVHLIIFIFFFTSGVPFALFLLKNQITIVSMFMTINTPKYLEEDLEHHLNDSRRLSSLSSLFKGSSFRSESRVEGRVEPFVVEIEGNASILVATPTSSRWNSRIIGLRPDGLVGRTNDHNYIADDLSISDYGSSSGVNVLSTPKIYSEGDFSAQQSAVRLPPRYFVG